MAEAHHREEPGIGIRSLWTTLQPRSRQWLMDHAGMAIIPRRITADLCHAANHPLPQDAHGQARLGSEDILFIRNRAHSAFAAHGAERFYDAVQPSP